jgi:hypothetical protein
MNVANIKKQKVATMEKSKLHEMMQTTRIHHINNTQIKMSYPNLNPNYSLL